MPCSGTKTFLKNNINEGYLLRGMGLKESFP